MTHLKNTLNGCHENQSVSCGQALDKLPEKFNSRLLVKEEHGFQKGTQCAPLATGAPKKPGLDRVKDERGNIPVQYVDSSAGVNGCVKRRHVCLHHVSIPNTSGRQHPLFTLLHGKSPETAHFDVSGRLLVVCLHTLQFELCCLGGRPLCQCQWGSVGLSG